MRHNTKLKMPIRKVLHRREIELKDLQKAYEYAKGYTLLVEHDTKNHPRW